MGGNSLIVWDIPNVLNTYSMSAYGDYVPIMSLVEVVYRKGNFLQIVGKVPTVSQFPNLSLLNVEQEVWNGMDGWVLDHISQTASISNPNSFQRISNIIAQCHPLPISINSKDRAATRKTNQQDVYYSVI